jgi:DNA-binding NtrC family response regulator
VLDLVDNGAACLSQMTEQSYDALLLDNHLPDTDGLDLLAELRAAGHLLPVVMVTGVGDDKTVARALRAGASDYVPKDGNYLQSLPRLLRTLVLRQQERVLFDDANALREQHVLYIESNDMDAELTQQHFASHAPRLILHMLNNCADALAWLSGPHDIDLVLTDQRMPGMDALEFVHEAKRCQIDLPFVVITGKGDEATAVALLRLGASDYLVKRDNYLMQLPHAIEHALHRFRLDCTTRRLHSELRSLNASLEAKVAERTAELQATQQRLRATFDAVPDLIW